MYLEGDFYQKKENTSAYQPSGDVKDLTEEVKREYGYGHEILHKSWEELNNYSVIDRMNKDQRTFNSFVDESVENPNEAWKWRGTRSMARNKAITMHAHLTSQYIVPGVTAQNEQQEEDRDAAEYMHDILQWMTINSTYRPAFLMATQGMLVNPVTYLSADYAEVMQKVKIATENGIETQEILDEELSGFQPQVMSADQVLITNAYIQNIQRQRSIIKRRYIEYNEAKALYWKHYNFSYVQSGIKCIYNQDDGLFYDVKDDDHPYLVEEVTFKSRRTDTECVFLNGVYAGDDNVEDNPMKHRDHRNAPKYDVVPFGYERINEHFFYYKSLINRVGWDHQLLDAMYETTMNRDILDLLAPVAVTGVDEFNEQIIFPGAVASFANPDARAQPILPPRNSNSGYQAMQKVEESISEGSVSDVQQGQLPQASQKAFSVARAEQNSRTLLSAVSKSLGESVAQYGQLMIDIALHHITVPEVDEITGALRYRKFILDDQKVDGKTVSKRLMFDEALMGRPLTNEQKNMIELSMLSSTDYPNNKEHLYIINPHLFSKRKYMIQIEPDTMLPKNEAFEKAVALEYYNIFRQDPLINPEVLVRKVAYAFFKSETDDLIAEQPPVMDNTQQMEAQPQSQLGSQQRQVALAQEAQPQAFA